MIAMTKKIAWNMGIFRRMRTTRMFPMYIACITSNMGKDAEGETVKAKVLITTVTRSVKCLIIDSGYPGVHVEQDSAVVEGVIK